MAYAIMRIEKIKTYQELAGVSDHNHRHHHTDNSDPSKRHFNKRLVGSTDIVRDLKALYQKRDIEKLRKNGVLAVEMVLSFSPEWIKEASGYKPHAKHLVQAWVKKCMQWVKANFGDNVVSCVYHGDELTPHLHLVLAVSYWDQKRERWRLSADRFFGSRAKLSALQTSHAQAVESLGLQRGVKGSRASHQTLRQFYTQLNKAAEVSISRCIKPPDRAPQAFSEWEERLAEHLNEQTEREHVYLAEAQYWKSRYMQAVGNQPEQEISRARIKRH